jgi:formamidopyrimidine-DNA glycosylase
MPELPEVETIAAGLRSGSAETPGLIGQQIVRANIFWPGSIAQPEAGQFAAQIAGQAVTAIGRRAKFLTLRLTQDTLVIHLRMSGDLLVEPQAAALAAHARLALDFAGGWRLAFVDPRKFGRAWLLTDPQVLFAGLGPEPFDPRLDAELFLAMLGEQRRQLKALLLDQGFIAGIGNIYADESLHRAGLHPRSLSHQLGMEQAGRLLESIRQTLLEGVRRHGASIDWVYRGGNFQNYFRVYQRAGAACPVCATPIERIVVGQRGTHFCPRCQPEPAPQAVNA